MFTFQRTTISGFDGYSCALIGSADLTCGDQLERGLTFALAGAPQRVIVDMAGLEFMGSFAIGQLVLLRKSLAQHAGRMALVGVRPEIHQTLKFSRLDELFEIYPSIDEAIAQLQG